MENMYNNNNINTNYNNSNNNDNCYKNNKMKRKNALMTCSLDNFRRFFLKALNIRVPVLISQH